MWVFNPFRGHFKPTTPASTANMPRSSVTSASRIEAIYPNVLNSMVSFPVHRRSRCKSSCDCACHSRSQYQTSPAFKRLLGVLFLGYVGPPLLASDCSDETCRRHSTRSLKIIYCFPQWFLARAVHIVATMTYSGSPVFGLQVRRRIEWGGKDGILRLALTGNTQGVKHLLVSKEASLTDVDPNHGRSALHVRADKASIT